MPDVCLLDIHMPGGGIAAADEISTPAGLRGRHADLLARRRRPLRLAAGGARGYLLKDMDPDRLGPALHGVLAGEAALPRSLVPRVLEEFQGGRAQALVKAQRPTQLTSREWEIMELLRDGLSTEEVADAALRRPGDRPGARLLGAQEAAGARPGSRHPGARGR